MSSRKDVWLEDVLYDAHTSVEGSFTFDSWWSGVSLVADVFKKQEDVEENREYEGNECDEQIDFIRAYF